MPQTKRSNNLITIRKAGFRPIATCKMFGLDCYVFTTKQEADKAYFAFERTKRGEYVGKIVAWWLWPERLKLERAEWKRRTGKHPKMHPCKL